MPGIDTNSLLKINRTLPSPFADGTIADRQRGSRYGETSVLSYIRKQQLLCDEGSYFVVNNNQTGIAASAVTAFGLTSQYITIYNTDSPSNQGAKRIYVDYINLVNTVAGSAASGLARIACAVVIDSGNRYSQAGSELTSLINNANMDVPKMTSVARVFAGAIIGTTAAGLTSRTLVGQRTVRLTVSATVLDVVDSTYQFNFGGVESPANSMLINSGAGVQVNALTTTLNMPPAVVGPNQSFSFYLWFPVGSTIVAPSYLPEIGWWER